MSNDNTIHLIGNLVDDPTLRYTTTEKPVANCRIAVNEVSYIDGQRRERTNYFNVVAWNAMAENLAVSVTKGDRIMVAGRLQIREAEMSDGDKSYFTEVVASEVGVSVRWAAVGDLEKNERPTPATVGAAAGDAGEPF